MFRKFLSDVRGNFLMLTGIAIVPIMGALALAIDYADMSRQRQDTLNALDAAGIAAARRILEGATEDQVRTYTRQFFDANLGAVDPDDAVLNVELPANIDGGGRVRLTADLTYHPRFLPPFLGLLKGGRVDTTAPLSMAAMSEVQLQNTVEVALVLDNSGSMDYLGTGSGKKRIELLRSAASQLVDQLAATATVMRQVENPVQFSVVPFAASVNIGASNKDEPWMDTTGISSIHHENFDWTTLTATNKKIQQNGGTGPYYKKGTGWGSDENKVVTRFTLFNDIKRCGNSSCTASSLLSFASWAGCVESRPSPYNTNDDAATSGAPDTLYVPMFAPDEAGDKWKANSNDTMKNFSAYSSWWDDVSNNNSAKIRQRHAAKYFTNAPFNTLSASAAGSGPNTSCTTTAITPLTDVTTTAGLKKVKDAIAVMAANGATNVPEGLAWGWRTLSSRAPFTGGRPETVRGNDKVVIVLTDGANTYYTPSSLGASDSADNRSIYSAYAYAYLYNSSEAGRLFDGTSSSVSKTDFSNDNYTKAMNEQFLKTCENANGGDTGGKGANLIVMTVALDLDPNKDPSDPTKPATADEKKQTQAQLDMLKTCASRSRYAKDATDPSKGRKLFWNATGANLSQVFKEIADELSNLRIVG
jgi:Flp pilus assembly protein TadG